MMKVGSALREVVLFPWFEADAGRQSSPEFAGPHPMQAFNSLPIHATWLASAGGLLCRRRASGAPVRGEKAVRWWVAENAAVPVLLRPEASADYQLL